MLSKIRTGIPQRLCFTRTPLVFQYATHNKNEGFYQRYAKNPSKSKTAATTDSSTAADTVQQPSSSLHDKGIPLAPNPSPAAAAAASGSRGGSDGSNTLLSAAGKLLLPKLTKLNDTTISSKMLEEYNPEIEAKVHYRHHWYDIGLLIAIFGVPVLLYAYACWSESGNKEIVTCLQDIFIDVSQLSNESNPMEAIEKRSEAFRRLANLSENVYNSMFFIQPDNKVIEAMALSLQSELPSANVSAADLSTTQVQNLANAVHVIYNLMSNDKGREIIQQHVDVHDLLAILSHNILAEDPTNSLHTKLFAEAAHVLNNLAKMQVAQAAAATTSANQQQANLLVRDASFIDFVIESAHSENDVLRRFAAAAFNSLTASTLALFQNSSAASQSFAHQDLLHKAYLKAMRHLVAPELDTPIETANEKPQEKETTNQQQQQSSEREQQTSSESKKKEKAKQKEETDPFIIGNINEALSNIDKFTKLNAYLTSSNETTTTEERVNVDAMVRSFTTAAKRIIDNIQTKPYLINYNVDVFGTLVAGGYSYALIRWIIRYRMRTPVPFSMGLWRLAHRHAMPTATALIPLFIGGTIYSCAEQFLFRSNWPILTSHYFAPLLNAVNVFGHLIYLVIAMAYMRSPFLIPPFLLSYATQKSDAVVTPNGLIGYRGKYQNDYLPVSFHDTLTERLLYAFKKLQAKLARTGTLSVESRKKLSLD